MIDRPEVAQPAEPDSCTGFLLSSSSFVGGRPQERVSRQLERLGWKSEGWSGRRLFLPISSLNFNPFPPTTSSHPKAPTKDEVLASFTEQESRAQRGEVTGNLKPGHLNLDKDVFLASEL